MSVRVIVVAAGRGDRLGSGIPKAFVRLGGRTLLERVLSVFLGRPAIERIVGMVPDCAEAERILGTIDPRLRLVRGGATRQESVLLGLRSLPAAEEEILLVHDAARPLVEDALVDAVIAATARHGAAVPVVTPADTVKRVTGDGTIEATLPRERLRLAQTPQGFRGGLLRRAYEHAARDGITGTDDASLVERDGGRVHVLDGSPRNLKITTPWDLALAEAILSGEGTGRSE